MERFSDKNFSYSSRSFGISKIDKIQKSRGRTTTFYNATFFATNKKSVHAVLRERHNFI